jgi:hypothetical protein
MYNIICIKMNTQRMYVIVNSCYGGFDFSENLKKELSKSIDTSFLYDDIVKNAEILRDNQIACNLLLKKGSNYASGTYSKLKLYSIPIEMKDYYEISEYDGIEGISLNTDKAKLKLMYKLLENPTQELADYIKLQINRIDSYEIFDVHTPE